MRSPWDHLAGVRSSPAWTRTRATAVLDGSSDCTSPRFVFVFAGACTIYTALLLDWQGLREYARRVSGTFRFECITISASAPFRHLPRFCEARRAIGRLPSANAYSCSRAKRPCVCCRDQVRCGRLLLRHEYSNVVHIPIDQNLQHRLVPESDFGYLTY